MKTILIADDNPAICHILSQYGIPLLRLKTDGSDEKKQIEQALRTAL